MNDNNKPASSAPPVSVADSGSSPVPYSSVAPTHMTDSMSRFGQGSGMGPDTVGRNLPPGSGPPPPPSAISPWQSYVYGVEPVTRGIAPFPGQPPYRAPYPAFAGQYSEPFDQFLASGGAPLPAEYPIGIRYPGDKAAGMENNGMGYPVMDNRTPSALPPFSSIASHPNSGRGPTPGLKDDMAEFGDGMGTRHNRGGGSGGPPTPGHSNEYGEGLPGRLIDRGMSRGGGGDDSFSSSSLVQYRPWEIGSAGRGDAPPSSHASPTSPSSSYSFAEGFLKFQPTTPTTEKGGVSNNGGVSSNSGAGSGGSAGGSGTDGSSPGASVNDEKSWYQGKGESPSAYSKDQPSALTNHPANSAADKHVTSKESGASTGSSGPAGSASTLQNAAGAGGNSAASGKNSNDVLVANNLSNEPNRPPAPSSVGYSAGGDSSGTEDGKVHMNSYQPYDGRDMLLSFGSPHQTSYDYYSQNAQPGGNTWAYSDMGKAAGYHPTGRPYNQNGRENVYGNGNAPDRPYQLSPHDRLLQTTPTPPPPQQGAAPGYQGNAHVPVHAGGKEDGKAVRHRRGGGASAAVCHTDNVGQVPSVSSSLQQDSKNAHIGHDDYGPPPAKQAAMASAADDQLPAGEKPKKKKRKRCGECYGCQRKDNCGECAPCRNEKSHQICKMRRCEKLIEKKVSSSAPAPPPPPPPTTQVQPASPSVSDKLQYMGGAGGGTAWW